MSLADEASGSQFEFDPTDISFWADADGVHCDLVLEALSIGERVRVDMESFFDTSDQSLSVNAVLKNLNPAILARLLPHIAILAPVEIALDIRLDAELDRQLAVQEAKVFASGSDGSLELASLIGRNVELADFSTNMTIARQGTETTFDIASLEWSGNKLLGQIVHSSQGPVPSTLDLDITLVNRSWSEVAPKWFSHLNLLNLPDADTKVTDIMPQRLAANVGQDGTKAMRGAGTIYVPNLPGYTPKDISPSDKEVFLIGLEVRGTRQSPVFKFDAAIETVTLVEGTAQNCRLFDARRGETTSKTCLLQRVLDPSGHMPLSPGRVGAEIAE